MLFGAIAAHRAGMAIQIILYWFRLAAAGQESGRQADYRCQDQLQGFHARNIHLNH